MATPVLAGAHHIFPPGSWACVISYLRAPPIWHSRLSEWPLLFEIGICGWGWDLRLLFELVKEERVSRGCPLGREKRKWLGLREALPGVRPCGGPNVRCPSEQKCVSCLYSCEIRPGHSYLGKTTHTLCRQPAHLESGHATRTATIYGGPHWLAAEFFSLG